MSGLRPRRGRDVTSQSGVSLVELIVVMTIIGILAVTAGARWQGDLTLYTKADQLINDIRFAQTLAMREELNFTILRVAGNAYQVQDSTGTVVRPTEALSGVTITPFSITFDSRGSPGAATQTIQLTMDGQSVTIRVVGNTGLALRS
ncbi:MAG: type II secretion system protein [Magnetococcales bacterium]|nr:type II secretion system protein [Magnetococcales bacterium]